MGKKSPKLISNAVYCQLIVEDKETYKIFRIEGLPDTLVRRNQGDFVEEQPYIQFNHASINQDRALISLSNDSEMAVIESVPKMKSINPIIGEKTVLMVNVSAKGPKPLSISDSEIARAVLGTNTGSMNSQYKACSHNKLIFKAASGANIPSDGVVSINLDRFILREDIATVMNDATLKLEELVGSIEQFDHVIFFVQFGTVMDSASFWNAYAMQHGRVAVFNNQLGSALSSLMHEVGHNFGLYHSTEGGKEYGDTTGYMGESFGYEESPLMCFNAAKSWRLGWYEDRHVSINLENGEGLAWKGSLYGVDDYGTEAEDSAVVAQIETLGEENIYFMYNSKKGINKGTMEYGDHVVIVSTLT